MVSFRRCTARAALHVPSFAQRRDCWVQSQQLIQQQQALLTQRIHLSSHSFTHSLIKFHKHSHPANLQQPQTPTKLTHTHPFCCCCFQTHTVSANARSLQSTRELQAFDISKLDLSKLPSLPALGLMPPGVDLPPLSEFLPPLDSINLPPLNEFLKSVGLPSW